MRSSLLAFVVVAACSRAPEIDLPVCTGGVPIDSSAKHSMTIDARGQVTVDGVACANEREIAEALGKVRAAMYSDPKDVRRSGREYASDPLVVRIDRATRWADAARWLAPDETYIYRKWIAVRDEATGSERCLRVDYLPRYGFGDVPYNPDWKPQSDRVLVALLANRASSSDGARHSAAWSVRRWQKPQIHTVSDATSWSEIRELLVETPAEDRDLVILGSLSSDTLWREVVSIVAEALQLFHADVEILYSPDRDFAKR